MGWLSNLFNKQSEKVKNAKLADVMGGYAPIFSQFGTNIYASDVVQQAIMCIVMEVKKLTPQHIKKLNNDVTTVDSSLQTVLNNPNQLMTASDFLEKITWQLLLNYNSFIIPTYYEWRDKSGTVRRKYDGLYPIQPSQVDFIEDAGGRLFVNFKFNNGTSYTIKYSDVIHLKYRYSVNQYMGGNDAGQPDNEALLKTLNLNHLLLQGVASAMKSSFAINGVVKYNTMLDDGKTEAALKELEAKLKRSENGFLPLDLKAEFIPIKKDIQLADPTTLKFIDEKILRAFGVSLPMLTGDYTKEQYEAFYQKTIEPLVINFSQAFTKTLFTERELAFGNEIKFYPHELIFMNTTQKIELFDKLVDTASCYKNELRTAFGMPPLPELAGQLAISSNKSNALNNEGDYEDDYEDDEDDEPDEIDGELDELEGLLNE